MSQANPQSTIHGPQSTVHSPQSALGPGSKRRVSGVGRQPARFTFHDSRITRPSALRAPRSVLRTGFTLLEVMIACGIFFMATFAILALVAGTLRNARALQRGDVDAGMAAAQIVQMLKTNRQADIRGSGDFGDAYRDFSYEFQSGEYMTNGLLQVDIIVNRFGAQKPVDTLTIWIYAPDAKSGYGARL